MIVLDTKTSLEVDGKTYYRWYYFREKGIYRLRFRIVSTNSKHLQGISLFFSDFKGELLLNGEKLQILKGFKHYVFEEGKIPNDEFVLSVNAVSGSFFIGNASEREETSTFTCGAFGSAFWIEQMAENHMRFHCNDHEFDDDFDDLIFDVELLEAEE